jgi:hypothetical protein
MEIENFRFNSLTVVRIERDSIVVRGAKGEICLIVNCNINDWDMVLEAVKLNDYQQFCKYINLSWGLLSNDEELSDSSRKNNTVSKKIKKEDWDKRILEKVGVGHKKVLQFAKMQIFDTLKSSLKNM